jgi:hypothetical protein
MAGSRPVPPPREPVGLGGILRILHKFCEDGYEAVITSFKIWPHFGQLARFWSLGGGCNAGGGRGWVGTEFAVF